MVETIKRQTRVAYGWLVVGQSVVAGLAYVLSAVRPLSVTWTAPLQLRYAACGAIQVLYAFAFTYLPID